MPNPSITSVGASTANGAYNTGDTISLTISFDEAVFVTGTPQLALSTGGVAGYVSGSGSSTLTFTYVVQAGQNSADLDYATTTSLSLNGGTIRSGDTSSANLVLPTPGTAGSLGANTSLVIDTLRPSAAIGLSDTLLKAGETATVTVTFSEAVTGFSLGDLSVMNGTLSGLSTSDNITWTATLTPAAGVSATGNRITLDNTGVMDGAGNAGVGTSQSVAYAVGGGPTATIALADSALTRGETTTVTITFSEAVNGFDNADLSVANGTLSAVSSTDGGVTWTATLTPTANVADASNIIVLNNAGVMNGGGAAGIGTTNSANYTIDTRPPPEPEPEPEPEPSVVVVVTPNGNQMTGDAQANLITSSGGADTIWAGGGGDSVQGGGKGDLLQGNAGADSIAAGGGADLVYGGQGGDLMQGNAGNDMLFGDLGDDTAVGGQGADLVQGGQGNDYVSGDLGDDVVRGGQGDDRVLGGAGDDHLAGDLGADTLTGGDGADTFHSFGGAGLDLVTDFNPAQGDRVALAPGTTYVVSQVGADVHVTMGGGGELVLAGVQLSSLSSGWILA